VALGRLSGLQERVLVVLAGLDPPWTLSGGAALVGFHTRHRETRDLDLFWQARRELGNAPDAARARIERAGLDVAVVQTAEAFCRLEVRDGENSVVVDLVADPVPLAEAPQSMTVQGASFLVDTPHQILVNKLCALLSRSEVRDLVDVRALLDAGGDLRRALLDAPLQDGGFSPLTLAWSMRGLPLRRLAAALKLSTDAVEDLEQFRDALVDRVLAEAKPEQ
jgi:hypothetical protein